MVSVLGQIDMRLIFCSLVICVFLFSCKQEEPKSSINLENINSLVVDLAKEFSVLTIYTQHLAKDICFVGQVEEIDDNTLLFHEFGTTSTLDRKYLLISVEEITKIEVNGHYEKNITKLFGLSK